MIVTVYFRLKKSNARTILKNDDAERVLRKFTAEDLQTLAANGKLSTTYDSHISFRPGKAIPRKSVIDVFLSDSTGLDELIESVKKTKESKRAD